MNFERGKEPKEAMNTGIEKALEDTGVSFVEVIMNTGFFHRKGMDGASVQSSAFTPELKGNCGLH